MKIACAHTYSKPLCIQENIENIEKMLDVFEEHEVCYALFPELGVSGYLNSKELLSSYSYSYTDINEQLLVLSQKYSFTYALGLPWLNEGDWYIAQVVYKQGAIIGMHFKTHLSENEKKIFAEGNEMRAIDLGGCLTGFQICLESHIPELTAIYEHKGVQLLSVPFASPRETPEEKLVRIGKMLQIRAYDNSLFVMACNATGFNAAGKPYAGFSTIISPRGEEIISACGYDQGYCISDVDITEIDRIKKSKMGYFSSIKRRDWLKNF